MTHTITLIPGDGIGPEVTEAVVRILAATGVSIEWERARRRRARVRAHGTAAAGRAPRLDPPQQGRAQGPGDDADRRGVHERQRRAAQGARPVREPAAGLEPARRARRGSRTSTSSSSARTPRTCTPASSTRSCPGVVESLKIITERASTRIARVRLRVRAAARPQAGDGRSTRPTS